MLQLELEEGLAGSKLSLNRKLKKIKVEKHIVWNCKYTHDTMITMNADKTKLSFYLLALVVTFKYSLTSYCPTFHV
jgi:hypothetical protein